MDAGSFRRARTTGRWRENTLEEEDFQDIPYILYNDDVNNGMNRTSGRGASAAREQKSLLL